MAEVIKEMFHLYRNKSTFTTTLNSGAISNDSICFIEDTREIWTQGNFYNIDTDTSNFIEKVKTFLGDDLTNGATFRNIIDGIKVDPYDFMHKIYVNVNGEELSLSNLRDKSLIAVDGSTKKIDSKYLPSYVDDVLEFATKNDFPNPGEKGKLYVATTGSYANTVWRWTGSTYIKVSGGEDKPITKESLGLGNVDNTSDTDKPISIKQQEALNKKVDKVNGKGLSTNDFTNEYKSKLDNYKEPTDYSTTIENLQTTVNNLENKLTWKIL